MVRLLALIVCFAFTFGSAIAGDTNTAAAKAKAKAKACALIAIEQSKESKSPKAAAEAAKQPEAGKEENQKAASPPPAAKEFLIQADLPAPPAIEPAVPDAAGCQSAAPIVNYDWRWVQKCDGRSCTWEQVTVPASGPPARSPASVTSNDGWYPGKFLGRALGR